MSSKEIITEIEIESGPERVWEVLTDLASYPEWNPMLRHASGELRPGSRLSLRFEPKGKKARNFRPKLLVVEPPRELRWLGNPGIPKLFESQHYFIIEPKSEDKILLRHNMLFYGLLVPLAGSRLEEATVGPFEDMNRALKERAESS